MTVPPDPVTVVGVEFNKILPNNLTNVKFSLADWCSKEWRKIMSEFISTMMLILFGCMSTLPLAGNTAINGPFGFGFVVLFNIQIFGHISGAFMNPAVTLGSVIWGSTSIGLGIVYIIVECAAAALGYGILIAVCPFNIMTDGICVTEPYPDLNPYQACGIEVALTAALAFVNCGVWDPANTNKQDSIPIKFGLTIAGLSLVGGQLTGASMNPARSLGPAIWTNRWTDHWIYWVGPFVGSGLATVFYKHTFLKKCAVE